MSTRYYYSKQGTNERHGPIAAGELAQLCRSGVLDPLTLLVCREGGEWANPIDDPALGLVSDAQVVAPAAQATQQGGIGYFSAGMDISARTKATLQKFATATGPRGEWPLNAMQLNQFAVAAMYRRRILAAHGVLRLFYFLGLIASAILLLVFLIMLASPRGGRGAGIAETGIPLAVLVGVTALYGFCARATFYCRTWGPLVPGILVVVSMLFTVSTMLIASASSSRVGGLEFAVVGFIIQLLIAGAFAYVFFRAVAAIPPYLNAPVWCQEALALSEQVK